jgi:predicted O-methyltransferase YrrM
MLEVMYRSARAGAAVARDTFRESRRRATEAPSFSSAADRAESIHGWLSRAEAELLFHLAARVEPGQVVVEIGSFLGRSTAHIALAVADGVPVYAIDPHTGDKTWVERFSIRDADTSPAFRRNMTQVGVESRVHAVVATSADAAAQWTEERPIGLLFIDGWHSSDAVFEDGSLWLPRLAAGGCVVFDDWASPEVWDGMMRLRSAGVLTQPALGFVGKDLLCGPPDLALPVRLNRVTRRHGPIGG